MKDFWLEPIMNGTNKTKSYEYDAYGNPTVYDASGSQIANNRSQISNRYTFQGREIDWTTGLIYFRARWYNPETGRWLSKDPIGIDGGLNLYVFCSNNPININDPSGESGLFGAIVGGIAGAISGAISGGANGGGVTGAIAGGVTGLFAGAIVGAINPAASSAVGAMVGGAVGGALGSAAGQLMTTGTVNPGAVAGAAVAGTAVAGVGVLAVGSLPAAVIGAPSLLGAGITVGDAATAGTSIVAGAATALASNAGGMLYNRTTAGNGGNGGCGE